MAKENVFITDLDGTFVKDSVNVKDIDIEVLKELQEQMKIGIATGRSMKEIEHIENITDIEFDYHIAFNGAMVKKDDEILYDNQIPKAMLKDVLDYIKENEIVYDVLTDGERIGTHNPEDTARLWNLTILDPNDQALKLEDMDIYKINLRSSVDEIDELVANLQKHFPDLAICKSGETRIEITSDNVTKGNAIQLLKDEFNYNVVSIGDSGNDISMFEESDLSICMVSGPEETQKHAMEIVDHFYQAKDILMASNLLE